MITRILFLILAATVAASGQTTPDPRATGNVWLDVFAGPAGAVVYPQYGWAMNTTAGKFAGYGFVEVAPHEKLFSNNLVNFTPAGAKWFTIHGELGGLPAHKRGFAQLGPRFNFVAAAPETKKVLAFAFAVYLPELTGIRTRNVLIAAESQKFSLTPHGKIKGSLEFFDRIFPDKNPDYAELWLVVHVKGRGWKHVFPVVHTIRDGGRYTVTAGVRIKP